MNRNKLYILLIISCTAGYTWLLLNHLNSEMNHHHMNTCMIKQVTNIPCPSCGATRSVLSILNGDILNALYWNPIGIILILIMTIAPLWITYDYFKKRDSLFNFYEKLEIWFKQKKIAIPAILLMMANWIWNIYKEL